MKRFFSITFFYYLCTNNHKVTKKMKQQETTPKTREQLFAEKAGKSYAVCYSQTSALLIRWSSISSTISTVSATTNTTAATVPCHPTTNNTSVRPSSATAGPNPSSSTPTSRIPCDSQKKREVPNYVRTNCYIGICLLVFWHWGTLKPAVLFWYK